MDNSETNERLVFPPGFLWGTATSSHQVEGGNSNNDWWAFEQRPGAIWKGDRSGNACDWWRNAEQDFDRMAEMGLNTLRLSVEWSRVEPSEGEFDAAAIARYREMLTGLHQRGMEPMVTLFHFSTPLWLARQGGWQRRDAAAYFRRFARHAVESFGDLVRFWCPLNEPNVYATLGYLFGEHAPGVRSLPLSFRVLGNLLQAHGEAYRVIRALDGNARVGLAKSMQVFEALDPGDWVSERIARAFDRLVNGLTLQAVAEGKLGLPMRLRAGPYGPLVDSLDFFGVNYYNRRRVSLRGRGDGRLRVLRTTPGAEVSDNGRNGTYGEVYPRGLYQVVMRAAELGKPIYVTENGLPDADDDQRPRFLLTHLAQLQRAIAAGADVRGFFHWTFTDNFEWCEGWSLRFGLVELDERTQVRTPRRSARLFSEIARSNAITRGMVESYAPEVLDEIFPGAASAGERVRADHRAGSAAHRTGSK